MAYSRGLWGVWWVVGSRQLPGSPQAAQVCVLFGDSPPSPPKSTPLSTMAGSVESSDDCMHD